MIVIIESFDIIKMDSTYKETDKFKKNCGYF